MNTSTENNALSNINTGALPDDTVKAQNEVQLDAITVGDDGLTEAGRDMLVKVDDLRKKLVPALEGNGVFVAVAALLDLVFFQATNPVHPPEVRATIVSLMVDQSQQASAALTASVTEFDAGEQPQILVSAAG